MGGPGGLVARHGHKSWPLRLVRIKLSGFASQPKQNQRGDDDFDCHR